MLRRNERLCWAPFPRPRWERNDPLSPARIVVALSLILLLAVVAGLQRPSLQLEPEVERASFHLAPGFRAELVVSEPLVKDPVALAFDPDGRIWVCEMQGYMPDEDGKGEGKPIGRVVVLEDTDGDGRMDKSTVFLDRLTMPRALALVKGGVLVAEPPHLWYCQDRDGGGRADSKIAIDEQYSPVTKANPEHLPNGLLWAMDNRIYSAKSAVCYQRKPDGTFERGATSFRGQWGLA